MSSPRLGAHGSPLTAIARQGIGLLRFGSLALTSAPQPNRLAHYPKQRDILMVDNTSTLPIFWPSVTITPNMGLCGLRNVSDLS